MKANQKVIEESAVKVAPEKFTWMKYKGTKAKLLTHTKRNGDIVRTRLILDEVYGYRKVKLRSTGKDLIQIVLKSEDMDLAYNLAPRSFITNILKSSKPTVLPKKFKKPIDIQTIDKDAPIVDKPTKTKKSPVIKPKPKKRNSIVWTSEQNDLYLKYIGSDGEKKEFEGYKKVNGSWKRVAEIITDKGLDYAIDSLTRMHSNPAEKGKSKELLKFLKTQKPSFISSIEKLSEKYEVDLVNQHDVESLNMFASKLNLVPEDYIGKLLKVTALDIKDAIVKVNRQESNSPNADKQIELGDGYVISVAPDGNGFSVKFVTPTALANEIVIWKLSMDDAERQATQTKMVHLKSPYLDKRWDSRWGRVSDVYLSDAPQLDDTGSEMYSVIYADGSMRSFYGRDMDKIITTQQLESTPEYQAKETKDIENREARNRSRQEALRKEREQHAIIQERIDGWLDTTSFSSLQKGKITKVLMTPVRYSGTINGIMMREEFVRSMISVFDKKPSSVEVPKYKHPTNLKWNRMDAYEQRELEKKIRLGEKKIIYRIGDYDVTKYEYLYALYIESGSIN